MKTKGWDDLDYWIEMWERLIKNEEDIRRLGLRVKNSDLARGAELRMTAHARALMRLKQLKAEQEGMAEGKRGVGGSGETNRDS